MHDIPSRGHGHAAITRLGHSLPETRPEKYETQVARSGRLHLERARYGPGMTSTAPSDAPQEPQPNESPEPDSPEDFPGAIPEPSPADGGPGGRWSSRHRANSPTPVGVSRWCSSASVRSLPRQSGGRRGRGRGIVMMVVDTVVVVVVAVGAVVVVV